MTHFRYWLLMGLTAVCGGFLAIERFAFPPDTAKWIAFGVAIGATVLSLAAVTVALMRVNYAFSGLSALAAGAAGWTVIAMLVFATPTAVWLLFAGGLVMLALAFAALAVHETTVERIVYALDGGISGQSIPLERGSASGAADGRGQVAWRTAISPPMRSWAYWLAHCATAATGAFVVLLTFAYRHAGGPVSLRWIAFALAIAATVTALGAIAAAALRGSARSLDGMPSGRGAALLVSSLVTAVAVALIVTMPVWTGGTARWLAFALGCGLVGASLLALLIHEITSERVRHELEVARPAASTAPAATVPQHA